MGGAFSSLNTALSALRYQQASLDIASTNIANASTDGYVRRRIMGQTVGAAAQPAVWSRSQEIGSGVQSTGVERMVDGLLDTRVRREHARQTFLDLKAASLGRIETGIAEPSDSGVAAAISAFKSTWHDLVNAPGSDAARSQVISSAAIVADAFNLQTQNISDEAGDQRARLLATTQEVNDVAKQLASTNQTIAASGKGGSDSATLMDVRDQLALRLAELTGAKATVRTDGGMDVELNGVALVTGKDASAVQITGGVNPDGSAGTGPVQLTVVAPDSSTTVLPVPVGGDIGATMELLDVDLPNYQAGLDSLMSTFASQVNAAHKAGFDLAGNPGVDVFVYDPTNPNGRLQVNLTSPSQVAAASVTGGVLDATNAEAMRASITIEDGYQRLVNNFGSSVASVQRLSQNQRSMSTQVDAAREQLAGVSIDEETVNMVMSQHSYEAAARVMTTVDEMLDTLINRTGMVGR